jgi:hypothetical protein
VSGPFQPFQDETLAAMASALGLDHADESFADDCNALQEEMNAYVAQQRARRDEEATEGGASRENMAELYERMGANLAALRQDLASIEQDATPKHQQARFQIVAHIRKKLFPQMRLSEVRRQIGLLEGVVTSLHTEQRTSRRGAKPDLVKDEYVVRLEEIYRHYTGRSHATTGENTQFVRFAAIVFDHNWPAWGSKQGGAQKAVARRFEELRKAGGRLRKLDPESEPPE